MKQRNSKSRKKDVDKDIRVIDLFAGPGGLGEGFSSVDGFRIVVSAEMEASAHATLRLRAFYRILQRQGKDALRPYFAICNEKTAAPTGDEPLAEWDEQTKRAWKEACSEALRLTLGNPADNERLDEILRKELKSNDPWVLIGGPPCQAYSLVGRARNRGKADYRPEDDHRHFLYREYLRIIHQYRPSVFVMENVKGILSSKVGGQKIFHEIIRDLADPDRAMGKAMRRSSGYVIHSLVSGDTFRRGDDPESLDARKFIVRAEEYGIPQARHRVILVGVREDIASASISGLKLQPEKAPFVSDVIGSLPRLRSRLSKEPDSPERWALVVKEQAMVLAKAAKKSRMPDLAGVLEVVAERVSACMRVSANESKEEATRLGGISDELRNWYSGDNSNSALKRYLNHESRGHMSSDLRRYLFAAAYAELHKESPKGHKGFSLPGLRPDHENWETGKFADRFRVQLRGRPGTTVTSHIAKDGHYFIHYDPMQCRSLTVREAARLQTFPDDYFFRGNRTQQYHQVGNAVPPFLAHQIARAIWGLFG